MRRSRLAWRPPSRPPASLLVLGSVVSIQIGQAFGKHLFAYLGPMGVASLRLTLAAAVLLLLWRPAFPRSWRTWGLITAFGASIAGMNLIYPALAYLPLGMATSLQLLGPLAVALFAARHRGQLAWCGLAILGVGLFYLPGQVAFSLPGLLFALASGAAMGTYLLVNRSAGANSQDGSLLAWAVAFAALLTLPFGIGESGEALLDPSLLLAGLGLAIVSAVIPYSLDLAALRRLPARLVGLLESLEPVVAGLAGLLVLGERLGPVQWLAIACITLASAGAVALQHRENGSRVAQALPLEADPAARWREGKERV
ncbi:EamA family transporter [Billgrantia saliphila]|uniref:EamA family transporter n=1 Tax=Billgrantia saliphila TaxID=1848458 RepID=UPI000CE544ED|nr:EamA family transporter [Halomonas saliphila]